MRKLLCCLLHHNLYCFIELRLALLFSAEELLGLALLVESAPCACKLFLMGSASFDPTSSDRALIPSIVAQNCGRNNEASRRETASTVVLLLILSHRSVSLIFGSTVLAFVVVQGH